jgi:hypothetical protein
LLFASSPAFYFSFMIDIVSMYLGQHYLYLFCFPLRVHPDFERILFFHAKNLVSVGQIFPFFDHSIFWLDFLS